MMTILQTTDGIETIKLCYYETFQNRISIIYRNYILL